jgi:hypothetical protein
MVDEIRFVGYQQGVVAGMNLYFPYWVEKELPKRTC